MPASRQAEATVLPMNPAPPVISTLVGLLPLRALTRTRLRQVRGQEFPIQRG
jgi:hypothetical protein